MNPKMIWANLAVTDVARTRKFYRQIGFKPNGPDTSKELASFLFGGDDFVIHFFQKDVLEKNIHGKLCDPNKTNEIIFTLSASSKAEVNNWAIEVDEAGGNVVSKPEEFGEGYYGFVFADPDGHRFNVFYMKGF